MFQNEELLKNQRQTLNLLFVDQITKRVVLNIVPLPPAANKKGILTKFDALSQNDPLQS